MKKILAIVLTAVIVGGVFVGIGYKSKGFVDWSCDTWLGKTDKEETPDGADNDTVAVDENGKPVTDGASMPAAMTFLRSAAESAQSDNASVTVTATIEPTNATYLLPTWTVVWQDDDLISSDVNEYVTVNVNSTLSATVTCKRAFPYEIDLVFSVVDYYGETKTAKCELNYVSRVEHINTLYMRRASKTSYPKNSTPFTINGNGAAPTQINIYDGSGYLITNYIDSYGFGFGIGTKRESVDTSKITVKEIRYSCSYGGASEWTSSDVSCLFLYDYIYSHATVSPETIFAASSCRPRVYVYFVLSIDREVLVMLDCDFRTSVSTVALSTDEHTFA